MTQPQLPQLRPRRTAQQPSRARSAWSKQRIFIVLAAIIGVGVLLYPTAAAWFSDRVHATEISGYIETVENLSPSAQKSLLDEARQFNKVLPSGPLRDPYSLNEQGEQTVIGSGSDAYKKMLDIGPGGMMARISIPAIHSDLPIFHGTDQATLAKGAGHLFGSGLPVGGTSTHSVLTAHTGFVNATLFDDLDKVADGDVFTINVLGEELYYRVNQIKTVLPEETDDLRKVDGRDYVTLVTCTPKGINSHRLLVRGERIDPPAPEDGDRMLPSQVLDPGFPWWALALVGAIVLAILVTRPRKSSPGEAATPDSDDDEDPPSTLAGAPRHDDGCETQS
ncbi:sortase A [Arthrobacter sp. 1088]|uniref:class C sortase n=1 Tax=Arthrobacter sp. 1088 TaxID=2817768 RepID=UPI002862FF38|nr:class C sortase [Arthrobacter sp. 1088]MDR6688323.1 sortase A [Arthrobacter sp. 1088]